MMYFLFIIKSALFDFSRNKLRTLLTSLGILIGVASVVLITAFGLGLRSYIKQQFESLGSNLIYVIPGSFSGQGGLGFRPGSFGATRFDEKDLASLKKINEVEAVVGVFAKTINAVSTGEEKNTDVFITTPEIFSVRNFQIGWGRLFDKNDINKKSKIAVLGPKIATGLYGTEKNALAKTIKLNGHAYAVVGILKPKGGGGFGGPDFDTFIYVPYSAAISINPDKKFISFYIQAKDENSIPAVKEKAKNVLLARYKKDVVSVVEQTEIVSTVSSIFTVLNAVLIGIAAISLLVGGIGIMNIMFVSVTERIKEIGIRRAIGARKRDILWQFLAEAIILSLFGGSLGLSISYWVTLIIQRVFPAYIDAASVMLALGVSSAIGIIFGLLPAKKAADLSPIDAIRYE